MNAMLLALCLLAPQEAEPDQEPFDPFQWARDLDTWLENRPLEDAGKDRDAVLFALPATPHEELTRRLAGVVRPETLFLTIAKGLDENGRPPASVFASELKADQPFGVIYGPMISREIARERPGYACVGTRRRADFDRTVALFEGNGLTLDYSPDVTGLSWAVILKNVYVPLIAAADALDLGDNVRGHLTARALAEIDLIVQHLGGHPGTVYTDAGLGDLITTLTSESSHHRRIGYDLVAGRPDCILDAGANIRSEGMHTLAMVACHRLFDPTPYPLFSCMSAIARAPTEVRERILELLQIVPGR